MPTQMRPPVYKSGELEIDLARRELRSRGIAAPLGGRAFEILEILVQAAGELVNKYDLINRMWPGAAVEENTLHAHISAVRRALGSDREMLKTVAGRGYRLLGTWTIFQDKSLLHSSYLEPATDINRSLPHQLSSSGFGIDRQRKHRAAVAGFPLSLSNSHANGTGWDRQNGAGAECCPNAVSGV